MLCCSMLCYGTLYVGGDTMHGRLYDAYGSVKSARSCNSYHIPGRLFP